MSTQFPYDDELSAGSVPTLGDLARVLHDNLRRWLDYLATNPPLEDLEQSADAIMDNLTAVNGAPGCEKEAIELALALSVRFERLSLWREWYKRLLDLYSPAVDRTPKDVQAKFYLCLIRYYLHRTDSTKAKQVIDSLLDLASIKTQATLQEAHLAAATVAMTLGDEETGGALLDDLFQLARETGNKLLLGKAYAVLTHYHVQQLDAEHAFETGQMVYSVGIALHHDLLILDGLQFMAAACQIAVQPRRALTYLTLATQYAYWSGDRQPVDYVWQTWGACYYYLGNYAEAEYFTRGALFAFRDSGHNHALALLGHGLSLMGLERFAEAETALQSALAEWTKLKRPVDQLYARHALAELMSVIGRHADAIALIDRLLSDALAIGARCPRQLLEALRGDQITYRRRLDEANQR